MTATEAKELSEQYADGKQRVMDEILVAIENSARRGVYYVAYYLTMSNVALLPELLQQLRQLGYRVEERNGTMFINWR